MICRDTYLYAFAGRRVRILPVDIEIILKMIHEGTETRIRPTRGALPDDARAVGGLVEPVYGQPEVFEILLVVESASFAPVPAGSFPPIHEVYVEKYTQAPWVVAPASPIERGIPAD